MGSYIILHLVRQSLCVCLENNFLATLPFLLPSVDAPPIGSS